MVRFFLFTALLLLSAIEGYSQSKLQIYFSGVGGEEIKKSQLSDTTIKLVTSINIPKKGVGVIIYFYGEGFYNVISTTVALGASIKSINNNKLIVGSKITISGLAILDPKTKKEIYFEGKSYKIVED